jgi:hypothetical protein
VIFISRIPVRGFLARRQGNRSRGVFVYLSLGSPKPFLPNLQVNLYTMKKGILLLLLFCSVFAEAQSLKEALFKGKLKNDNNTVIRKGEDLSKMAPDTTRKAAPDTLAIIKADSLTMDSVAKGLIVRPDSAALTASNSSDTTASEGTDSIAVTEPAPTPTVTTPAPKSNNALMKEYVDSVATTLQAEVLASKRIKKGIYYVTVSYAIETDGRVDITDVLLTPENAFLQSQTRTQLELAPPRLEPVLASNGTPRKVSRKYNFTLTKE